MTRYCVIDSPVGALLLAGDDTVLERVSFQNAPHAGSIEPDWDHDEKPFRDAIDQLRAYFAGTLTGFDLPLWPQGTEFQQKVWRQLVSIPYGQTATYGQIAQAVGNPRGSRAVGAANGKNPLAIVIPCHRVIGSSGRLVGYSCGLKIKEALLSHECRYVGRCEEKRRRRRLYGLMTGGSRGAE